VLTIAPKQRERHQRTPAEAIRPQGGPQERFLACSADICLYGGSAGGGKTFALLMEAARHIDRRGYSAVIFRRTYPEVTQPGGLWPESMNLYPLMDAKPNGTELSWKFPSGAKVQFGHIQYAKDVLSWRGAQIALIGFDQLESFEEQQFWYLLSRNRSTCGVRPYIRATANPQPGWLADFIAWWIDQTTGFPIPERSGVIRWMVRRNDDIVWGDDPAALQQEHGTTPKSVTFIGAKLTDNPKLMEADPGYLANLQALPRIDRERLEKGNWSVSNSECEWPAEFFDGIFFDEWPENWSTFRKVMALDPSKGSDSRTGDDSSWAMLAVDMSKMTAYFDFDMDNRRPVEPLPSSPGMRSIVTDGIDLAARFGPCGILIESNGMQELIVLPFIRWATQRGLLVPVYHKCNTVNKELRIITGWNPLLAQRRVKVKNTPGGRRCIQQLRDFKRDQKPSAGIHDDGPDSGELALDMFNETLRQVGVPAGVYVCQA